MSYFRAVPLFGTPKDTPTDSSWYKIPDLKTQDQYQFFLDAGPLSNLDHYFEYEQLDNPALKNSEATGDFFWKELKEHPNYDTIWQSKGIIQHFDSPNGPLSNQMWALEKDMHGRLWAVTQAGLQVFDPKKASFNLFDEAVGLHVQEPEISDGFLVCALTKFTLSITKSTRSLISLGDLLVNIFKGKPMFSSTVRLSNKALP